MNPMGAGYGSVARVHSRVRRAVERARAPTGSRQPVGATQSGALKRAGQAG